MKNGRTSSPIYTHHIDYINKSHYSRKTPYAETAPEQIVIDYIASMTDDYFVDLYRLFFPRDPDGIVYKGYFD